MEKPLNCIFLTSLEEITLRKIAIAMFSEPSILALIARFKFDTNTCYEEEWRREDWFYYVKNRLFHLQLPEFHEKRIKPILEAVGSEILKWKMLHQEYFYDLDDDFSLRVLKKLCWTPAGMVDSEKTAEELVCFGELDISKRFELACYYCLEDYIPVLWRELPEESKRSFCGGNDISKIKEVNLELFFPYIERMESKYRLSSDEYSSLFEYSALCGNKALVKYHFLKLTKDEREASLVQTAKEVIRFRNVNEKVIDRSIKWQTLPEFLCYWLPRKGRISEVVFYLLSLMTPQEQTEIFKELPHKVLYCFLAWPWHDLFFAIADVVWNFLPKELLHSLVCEIILSIKRSGYYFPNFVQNLFQHSPVGFREQFIGEEYGKGYCFWKFFADQDSGTIRVVLRSIAVADRVRFVFSKAGLELIFYWIDNWHVMEVFLQEASLTKEEKERLKNDFLEFVRKRKDADWVNVVCKRLFDFLDESKGKSGDETSTVVKKISCGKNSSFK